jgi:hypothetical protein
MPSAPGWDVHAGDDRAGADDVGVPTDEELDGLVPDLTCGVEAWLTATPVGTVLADPDLTEPAQPYEALPGLPPHHLGSGAGFDAGGAAGELAPGPELATLVAEAWNAGPERLSDDELIGLLLAWRRLNSWTAAGELAAVAELERRRNAQVEAGADPHLAEHLADELAVALTLTTRSADRLLGFAWGLSRLPRTTAALTTGDIDRDRALVIADEVSGLSRPHASAVEDAVIGRAPRQTTGQLRASARRAALAADPGAARRRQEKALKDARVEVWDERSGTAALAGRDLPPADVLAADKRIDALAKHLKATGHDGTLDQLRARVYTSLLLGQPIEATPAPEAPAAGGDSGGQRRRQAPGVSPAQDAGAPATGAAGHLSRLAGNRSIRGSGDLPYDVGSALGGAPWLTGSVNLIMPLGTWLGASEAPGEVAGFGPVSADDARGLAAWLARRPDSGWCLTFTDSEGRAVAHGCARARRPDRNGNGAARAPGSPTESTDSETREPPRDWELTVTVRSLAVSDCVHAREAPGYRPSTGLRHILNTRQRTCGFPGCRRPAFQCDLDHTVPYGRGGRTCECGLAPLCRRHHRAKQAQGWRLVQPEPGVLYWRLPHGRTYRVEPDPYPVESGTAE